MIKRPGTLAVELPFRVQTYDIDFAGHVSNLVYLRWTEDLRLEVLERYFPLSLCMESGYTPILISSSITYKRAVKLFDEPHGIMCVSRSGNARLTFEAEIRVGGQVMAQSLQLGAFVDLKTHRPLRIPEHVARAFDGV